MKKFAYAAIISAGAALVASQAVAEELWDPHLRGVNEGLAAGALPPPGVYGVMDNYWAAYNLYNNTGSKVSGTSLNALVEVPIVLWATGIKFLGADYAVAIAQPFDYTSFQPSGGKGGSGNWGTFNTILIPGQLAWTFGEFHVKTGLTIYIDDASSAPTKSLAGTVLTNGGLPSGNGFWTVQPDLGLSWLHDGWNVSADLHYAINVTSNGATGYSSGDEFAADYTIAKTLGKWTFGLGVHQENQTTADTGTGAPANGKYVVNFGLGPLVSYQFGGINVLAEWNHNIYTQNDVAGDLINVRLVVPF